MLPPESISPLSNVQGQTMEGMHMIDASMLDSNDPTDVAYVGLVAEVYNEMRETHWQVVCDDKLEILELDPETGEIKQVGIKFIKRVLHAHEDIQKAWRLASVLNNRHGYFNMGSSYRIERFGE
jgi:hypothetical protein